MDAREPEGLPPDAELPPGWTRGWTFRIGSDDAPRVVPVDPETVVAARAAVRAMQEALLEAQRQSLLLDAAVASLVEQGAHAGQVMGDVGISGPVAERLVGGMPMLEVVCRDVVADADRRAAEPSASPEA